MYLSLETEGTLRGLAFPLNKFEYFMPKVVKYQVKY